MAMIDKQILIKELERALYDKLTAKDVNTVAMALMDRLADYDLTRKEGAEATGDSEELIKIFIDAKRVAGCSEKTLKRYRYCVKRMLAGVKVPVREVTVYHLRGYLQAERERGISENTLSGTRQVFSTFFGWLHREELIPSNPCANLAPIRIKKEKKKPFTDVEIEKLKTACNNLRDKAIISFLLATGCRHGTD